MPHVRMAAKTTPLAAIKPSFDLLPAHRTARGVLPAFLDPVFAGSVKPVARLVRSRLERLDLDTPA